MLRWAASGMASAIAWEAATMRGMVSAPTIVMTGMWRCPINSRRGADSAQAKDSASTRFDGAASTITCQNGDCLAPCSHSAGMSRM